MDEKTKKTVKKQAVKRVKKAVRSGGKNKGALIALAVLALVLTALVLVGVFTGFFSKGEAVGFDESKLSVYYLDVGQGDSILLRSPGGKFMLIDAGKNKEANNLVSMLNDLNVKTIEYFVLTHPDEDHVGGADVVLQNFEVKTVLSSDAGANTKTWRDVLDAIDAEGCADITVTPGSKYTFFEGCTFTILGPPDTGDASNVNNQSVVLRMDYGSTSFLFTGDAEKEEEEAMMKSMGESAFRADVLKVGHHGSSSSSSAEFLAAVKPDYAVISCGKDNSYGHPHDVTVKRLQAVGATILRTDEGGTILLQSDGKEVSVVDAPEKSPFEKMLDTIKGWFR